ncbi:MAG: hypothetical protein CEO12_188 [Parcubacteria group bacterium Gr01-1014_46]|nr:MAG: hypothetical protein CEO12_188 [Parcubacteria group bacterium Gr01-1014_46]
MNWLSNKLLIYWGVIGSIVFFLLIPKYTVFKICSEGSSLCVGFLNYLLLVSLSSLTVIIPSLLIYFWNKNIFSIWRKTLIIYFIIYILILIFVPWYSGDEFLHTEKDLVAIFISLIYLVFSLILILYKSLKKDQI